MISVEGILESIWTFLKRFWITFIDSMFRPQRFFKNLLSSPHAYISPRAYLFMGVIVSLFFHRVFSKSWFAFVTPEVYKSVWNEFSKLSAFELILFSAPIALIIYFTIRLLQYLLRIKGVWSNFYFTTVTAWFASTRILQGCMILFVMLMVRLFNEGDGLIELSGWVLVFLNFLVEEKFIWICTIALFIVQLWALYKRFFLLYKPLLVKLVLSLVLVGYSFFLFDEPFEWADSLAAKLHLSDNKDVPGELKLYNYSPADKNLAMTTAKVNDSVSITCSVLLVNNTNSQYYIKRSSWPSLNLDMNNSYKDTAAPNSFNGTLYFEITRWYDIEDKPVLFIAPGDKKILTLKCIIPANQLGIVMKICEDNKEGISLELPIQEFYANKKEDMPSSKSMLFNVIPEFL